MPAKLATSGPLKKTKFQRKGYRDIIPVDDTKEILLPDSSSITDVVMWPKFQNYGIYVREVLTTLILYEFDFDFLMDGLGWISII